MYDLLSSLRNIHFTSLSSRDFFYNLLKIIISAVIEKQIAFCSHSVWISTLFLLNYHKALFLFVEDNLYVAEWEWSLKWLSTVKIAISSGKDARFHSSCHKPRKLKKKSLVSNSNWLIFSVNMTMRIYSFRRLLSTLFSFDLFYLFFSQNSMQDSVQTFSEVVNNQFLEKTDFIILFNKEDLFLRKLKFTQLSNCFPDYKGNNFYLPYL